MMAQAALVVCKVKNLLYMAEMVRLATAQDSQGMTAAGITAEKEKDLGNKML